MPEVIYFVVDRDDMGYVNDLYDTTEIDFANENYFREVIKEEFSLEGEVTIENVDYGGNRLFSVYKFYTNTIPVSVLNSIRKVEEDKSNFGGITKKTRDLINDILESQDFPLNSDFCEFLVSVDY